MKIDDYHLYHGAALTQIAEHPQFTAINAIRFRNRISRSAFRVNDEIGVYVKYARKPSTTFGEYHFNFNQDHLGELERLQRTMERVYGVLVCVRDQHLCCLRYTALLELITRRRNSGDHSEKQYSILVTLPRGGRFRVYVNRPRVRGSMLGDPLIIARTQFPAMIFA